MCDVFHFHDLDNLDRQWNNAYRVPFPFKTIHFPFLAIFSEK